MASIREKSLSNGKKSYLVRIRIKGRPPITKTFARKTDAKLWATQMEADIKRGVNLGSIFEQKRTLGELIDRYLEEELHKRHSGVRSYKQMLTWWKEQLGSYYISELTPQIFSKYRDILQKTPMLRNMSYKDGNRLEPHKKDKFRSNSTINRYLNAISIVYTFAIEDWAWANDNPLKKVKYKKEVVKKMEVLPQDKLEKLLSACRNSYNKNLFPAVMIAITTGARYSEIMNLKWCNIDFKNKKIYVLDTKNGDSKGLHITDMLYNVLIQHSKIRRIDSDYLFPSDRIKNKPESLTKSWMVAKRVSGVEIRFHDLRHLAASFLAMSGGTLLEIAQVLGHKTLQMVKRYSHLTENHVNTLVDKMAQDKLSFLEQMI